MQVAKVVEAATHAMFQLAAAPRPAAAEAIPHPVPTLLAPPVSLRPMAWLMEEWALPQ